MKPATALIFAYGSNLDTRQMLRRCPGAEPAAAATLEGWRIAFAGYSAAWQGGVATLLRERRGHVEGIVWRIDRDDLARLDLYEGVPLQYTRVRAWAHDVQTGRRIAVQVYVLRRAEPALPSREYITRIGRAYATFGFDPKPLYRAVREAGR